jgi:hypothetical protein
MSAMNFGLARRVFGVVVHNPNEDLPRINIVYPGSTGDRQQMAITGRVISAAPARRQTGDAP